MSSRPVDLSACETEPIHMIGAIQPIGALIAVDQASLVIEFASLNAVDYFGRSCSELLGRPLSFLLGGARCAELLARDLRPSMPDLLRPWFVDIVRPDGSIAGLECLPHLHDGRIILEFVGFRGDPASIWEEDLVRQRLISDLIRPDTLAELAQAGTKMIREVTGFDRVMIYRFAEDKHGEVIAESTIRDDSFLGLHYPASDIPDPARRHFVLNLIRIIPDINATPVPIMTRTGEAADVVSATPLDLTFSKLRAVAPVHIEYLNNMGVGASMSISLTSNHELWGLVACHHYGPFSLDWSTLRFCELLGGTISALLQSLENTVKLRHSIKAEKTAFAIESDARAGKPLLDVVRDHAASLMEQCSAQGIILKLDSGSIAIGMVPEDAVDYAPLRTELFDGIATSDALSGLAGMEHLAESGIAGAAMMELSEDGENWLILLREAFEQTIRWAGRPDKAATRLDDGTVRLSPRGSFALWREERRGRSKPFTEIDREFLRITRRAVFAINSLDRERKAVAAKSEAEAKEARMRLILLESEREHSMGELASALAHELNQPLAALTNYLNACRQELSNYGLKMPEKVERLMDSALSESSRAADLVRRLRNFISQGELVLEPVDLRVVIRQGIELALAATPEAQIEIELDLAEPLPLVWADPVQIGQVILNLVRNSLTAMRDTERRILRVSTRIDGGFVVVSVKDTGVGIAPDIARTIFDPFHNSTTSGMGIGLSLSRSIVEAHGGSITTNPVNDGAEFIFTLKLNGQHSA